jgi:hypothetical protein
MAQMQPASSPAYISGVCNINHAEIGRRRLVGYIGTTAFIIIGGGLWALHVTSLLRLLVFIPATMAASGYLQASHKFCSGYGGRGLQNADDGSKAPQPVENREDAIKDRRRALVINLQSLAVGVIVTIIYMVIVR